MRSMSRRTMIALTIALPAGAIVGLIAYQRLTAVTPEGDPVRYWRREADRVFDRMATIPVGDTERIASEIFAAPLIDPRSLLAQHGGTREALVQEVLEFVSDRMEASSPEDYLSRRRSRGYDLMSADEFKRKYSSWSEWGRDAGVESDDPIEVMGALWNHEPARRARVAAFCAGEDASFVTIGLSKKHSFIDEVPFGTLGYDLWHGASAATCRVWTTPPLTREELVERDGETLAATVGLIADVPASKRRPVMFSAFWDKRANRWWVDGVGVLNCIPNDGSWACMEW